MRKFLGIVTISILFTKLLNAQGGTGTLITGQVFDGSTKEPLEFATVSVINEQSEKVVTGSIADNKGEFKIAGVPFGTYKIDINFIGYNKNTENNVKLGPSTRSVSLGKIFISPSSVGLAGVTITASRPVVENKIDKVVYNPANDITSQGGLATDVLKKVPQVTVDIDGNVELQGNSNIRFLINGKPSSVFGSSVSDALASIPASQIARIEAITNPGAKYDSQGTGGIINIILKDNNMEGVNGNINVSAGSRLENGSANFNLRHKNFGVNAFFGGRAILNSKVPFSQSRMSTDSAGGTLSTLDQNGTSDSKRNGFRSGLGFDWDITQNDNITGSLGYNRFRRINSGLTNQEQLTQDFSGNTLSDILTSRYSDSHSAFSSLDWSLDFKRKFRKEGHMLEILYDNSAGKPESNYTQTQTYIGESVPYSGSSSNNPGSNNETNVSVDYSNPISEKFLLETGGKLTYQNIKSIANVSDFIPSEDLYRPDVLQSYNLKYKMTIYAGYLSTTFNLFNFLNIKSGVRYESTNVNIDFPDTYIPSYGTLVPSLIFSHNLDKNQSVKLAYGKRIERPEYRELNPFINLSDPYNISTGNPLLKPEIGHKLELGYSGTFKKGGNVNVSLLEVINTQNVTNVTTFYPTYLIGDSIYNNVSVTNRQNIGKEYNSGISASGSFPMTSNLNFRTNLLLTHRYLVSNISPGNLSTGLRLRLRMNLNYQLPKDLVFEVFGFYSSPTRDIQGKVPQFFIYNFAFRKLFWNKNASFGFTTTNPFNRYINRVRTITTDNSTATNIMKMPFRSFGISLTYKFGKLDFDNSKNNGNDNNNQPFPGL